MRVAPRAHVRAGHPFCRRSAPIVSRPAPVRTTTRGSSAIAPHGRTAVVRRASASNRDEGGLTTSGPRSGHALDVAGKNGCGAHVSPPTDCSVHQFAGGSLAGNEWRPHSSTMSNGSDAAVRRSGGGHASQPPGSVGNALGRGCGPVGVSGCISGAQLGRVRRTGRAARPPAARPG
jgi:hypothetical protein